MKKMRMLIILIGIFLTSATYASWFTSMLHRLETTNLLMNHILDSQNSALKVQKNILSTDNNIEKLMKQVNANMIGNSGWGTYQYHDYQSYGSSARDWSSVMAMAENGQGTGDLGGMMKGIHNQFPSDRVSFNKGVKDSNSQKYYALKSQTILAARAASQLDYNKIQDQILYQQMLQQQIEKTKDLKAAIDLNNRIQVEGNLISLEILRQTALSNQQQAISEQATVNAALFNAKFLTK